MMKLLKGMEMEKRLTELQVAGAIGVAFFWDLPPLIQLLLILMAGDIAVGVLRAIQERALSSRISFQGITKKAMVLVLVSVFYVIDSKLAEQFHVLIPGLENVSVANGVVTFYVLAEFISLMENIGLAGVPIPEFLAKVLPRVAQSKDHEKTPARRDGITPPHVKVKAEDRPGNLRPAKRIESVVERPINFIRKTAGRVTPKAAKIAGVGVLAASVLGYGYANQGDLLGVFDGGAEVVAPAGSDNGQDVSLLFGGEAGHLHTSVYPFGQANFREAPKYKDNVIAVIQDGTALVVLGTLDLEGSLWYLVEIGGVEGYLHSSVVQYGEPD